jgi:tRNA modification GTPase
VAIVGRPNAGKSTLLNALAGRDAAITSIHAGTTRDVIEVRMELHGLAVTLLDTAGLRETVDEVEAIGVARGLARARAADLRLFLLDSGEIPLLAPLADDLLVRGKSDLKGGSDGLAVSGLTGQGLEELTEAIARRLETRVSSEALITRARHRDAVARAEDRLVAARAALISATVTPEIVAEDLRFAVRALESLVGRIDVEHVLDDIFSSFCIGK